MNRRALAANIPPMSDTGIAPTEGAEELARAMEAALENGGVDHAMIEQWASEVRELGRVVASFRRDFLRRHVQERS